MPFKITEKEFKNAQIYYKKFIYDKNEKINCDVCGNVINSSYYDKHCLTKKHIYNKNSSASLSSSSSSSK